ncbi:MAG TPA: exodeoxyribonuclease VII large subunit, partial [Magnetospirillaceae bacterium]|nr:exodeoxyribonuclease VII large subunit [Magnetospirillaceae bacterium]
DELSAALRRSDPRRILEELRRRTREAHTSLRQTFARSQEERRGRLAGAAAGLRALGPYRTLARGYAIVFDDRGHVVTDARRTAIGQPIDVLLKAGALEAQVTGKEERDGRLDLEEED